MHVSKSKNLNLNVFTPDIFEDYRGCYVETYNEELYKEYLPAGVRFIQDDISRSRKNVLRGLHGDNETWKLIQCLQGKIMVAVMDIRMKECLFAGGYKRIEPINNSTFGSYDTFIISAENRKQVLVPPGFVNGHLCLSDECIFSYKQTTLYTSSENQVTVNYNLISDWPPDVIPILSKRDSNGFRSYNSAGQQLCKKGK